MRRTGRKGRRKAVRHRARPRRISHPKPRRKLRKSGPTRPSTPAGQPAVQPASPPETPDLNQLAATLNRTLQAMVPEMLDLGVLLQAAVDPFGALPLPPPLIEAADELAPAGDDPFGSTELFSKPALPPAAAPVTPAVPLPSLRIELEEDPARDDPARMEADTILVNTAHRAWRRAMAEGHLGYHLAFCLGWTLAGLVEPARSGRRFLSTFLALWGTDRLST